MCGQLLADYEIESRVFRAVRSASPCSVLPMIPGMPERRSHDYDPRLP